MTLCDLWDSLSDAFVPQRVKTQFFKVILISSELLSLCKSRLGWKNENKDWERRKDGNCKT